MINENEKCICGHGKMYHVMERRNKLCNFKGCKCKDYILKNAANMAKAADEGYFLGGFVYTEDEICTCKHGVWDHGWSDKKGCSHYIPNPNKRSRKKWIKCPCKKFISKTSKQEVKKWLKKKKKVTKSAQRVKKK